MEATWLRASQVNVCAAACKRNLTAPQYAFCRVATVKPEGGADSFAALVMICCQPFFCTVIFPVFSCPVAAIPDAELSSCLFCLVLKGNFRMVAHGELR